ncbi:MAG: hypothetical protein MI924_19570 [Chloroflexales bacterium]|nr:hypothetical protein [Chloroflexales bacterium]
MPTFNRANRASSPRLDQFVYGDRQVADTPPGGVVNGVGDGGVHSAGNELANAFRSGWIDVGVALIDKDDIDSWNVGVDQHKVVEQVGIHQAAQAGVWHLLFAEAVPAP